MILNRRLFLLSKNVSINNLYDTTVNKQLDRIPERIYMKLNTGEL